MNQLLLVAGVILVSGGIVLAFRSASSGVSFSYLGISSMRGSGLFDFNDRLLIFWAIAALIVLLINQLRNGRVPVPNVCRNYIVGGALAGMVVGLTLGYATMVAGAMAGALLGAVAWQRTASGAASRLPVWRPAAEIGLPAVVTMSIAGMAVAAVVNA